VGLAARRIFGPFVPHEQRHHYRSPRAVQVNQEVGVGDHHGRQQMGQALGDRPRGVARKDTRLVQAVQRAGARTGDEGWRMTHG
jgi:hypothetical protein